MLTLYNPVEYIRHVTLLPFCKEDDFATAKVRYSSTLDIACLICPCIILWTTLGMSLSYLSVRRMTSPLLRIATLIL